VKYFFAAFFCQRTACLQKINFEDTILIVWIHPNNVPATPAASLKGFANQVGYISAVIIIYILQINIHSTWHVRKVL